MEQSVDSVYRQVYDASDVYRNDKKGLWHKRTFCLVGFEQDIDSGKDLIMLVIASLVSRGASVFKLPNKKLDSKTLAGADFFLCNYSLSLSALNYDLMETKLVTPIWLYACNRDALLYDTQLMPIFTANGSFYPLMFAQEDITVYIVNQMDSKVLKDSADVITRFARHCGFKIRNPGTILSDVPPQGKTYFLVAQTMDKKFDSHIIAYVNKYKVPCLAMQWIIDCYIAGEIEDVKKYCVDIQFEATTYTSAKKRKTSPIDATIAACIQHKRTVCLSYAAALESSDDVRKMIRNDEINLHVVNPIHLLAPWTLDLAPTRERSLYNNLSLVNDSRIMLYISPQEAEDGAIGIFAHISILMEDYKYRYKKSPKGLRNIEIHNVQEMYMQKYPATYSAINIPQELIAGESLVPRGLARSFNLYDLADSIAFMGEDTMFLEEEQMRGQDAHIRHR
ncbi:hypothetical protein X943_003077 [Babesia divergens]|uniref:BRCT domain-containing protein n=1 Tax=Babesia divergens TaxID=32595 RepID=A0AAD9GHQ3_BABDI|nr:hypothetical protein X943_003077 [Babesia divergens]